MKIGNFDILSPFEPPHLDSVTGLTISKGRLISGSKDKHLRLWSLDHSINNSKHTLHIFNDYVNTLHSKLIVMKVLPGILLSMLGQKTGMLKFAIQKMIKFKYCQESFPIHSLSMPFQLYMKTLTDLLQHHKTRQ